MSASLQVQVGQVDEVTTVTFAPAVPGQDSIDSGGEAELVLSALNDAGSGSDPSSLLSIVLVTTGGSLTAPLPGLDCAITCVLFENDLERLSGIGDGTAGRISFTLRATDEAGAASVQARVVSSVGELFEPPPLAFTFTGEQQQLALGPAPNSLLYRAAAGDGDETRLEVTAVNTSGRPTIPASDLTIRITGPAARRSQGRHSSLGRARRQPPIRAARDDRHARAGDGPLHAAREPRRGGRDPDLHRGRRGCADLAAQRGRLGCRGG